MVHLSHGLIKTFVTPGSRVRTVTLEMAITVIKELVLYRHDDTTEAYLHDRHLALVEVQ